MSRIGGAEFKKYNGVVLNTELEDEINLESQEDIGII